MPWSRARDRRVRIWHVGVTGSNINPRPVCHESQFFYNCGVVQYLGRGQRKRRQYGAVYASKTTAFAYQKAYRNAAELGIDWGELYGMGS
jgi:hypothetical protein